MSTFAKIYNHKYYPPVFQLTTAFSENYRKMKNSTVGEFHMTEI